jgi:hypothetical protein
MAKMRKQGRRGGNRGKREEEEMKRRGREEEMKRRGREEMRCCACVSEELLNRRTVRYKKK